MITTIALFGASYRHQNKILKFSQQNLSPKTNLENIERPKNLLWGEGGIKAILSMWLLLKVTNPIDVFERTFFFVKIILKRTFDKWVSSNFCIWVLVFQKGFRAMHSTLILQPFVTTCGVGLKSSDYYFTGHQTCQNTTGPLQDFML